MTVADVRREAEEASAVEAARLVFVGKAPARLLAMYTPLRRTRRGIAFDPRQPVSGRQGERLRAAWPDAQRLAVAFRLALDVEACADLLDGRPVDPDRLDPAGVRWARERMLVSLAPALDALEGAA